MCLSACTCVCGDSHSIGNQKVGRPTGEGGCKLPDNPGQTGEEGLIISSFMNAPSMDSQTHNRILSKLTVLLSLTQFYFFIQ